MHLQSSRFCGHDVWLDKDEEVEFYTYWCRFTVKQTYDKLQPKRMFTLHISDHHSSLGEWNADIAIHGLQIGAGHADMLRSACEVAIGYPVNVFRPQDVSRSCPYAVFPQVLDALLRLYYDSVWAVRNHISQYEARRSQETDYFLLHEIARHGVDVSETLSVVTQSLDAM
ncbi:hypothetical protein BU25DRAFT_460743 [Macroventuria anomochaeta]|uniref:Uncharacterized protein n=1 Tax=Macroventuria anomochaeta TaxID=301207 RepID=A0ACB6RT54_9PLEO|nr:uncharacterized protein BU25DRAFT_460743 [Macroventuria anomochaeta]KAF2624913.1 hypothetical protein BU25DRAFT_460743 [Macroventuria anomochaeta]